MKIMATELGKLAVAIADRSDDFMEEADHEDSDGNRSTYTYFHRARFLATVLACAQELELIA